MVEYTFVFDRVTVDATPETDIVTSVYLVIIAKYVEDDLQFSIGRELVLGPTQEIIIPFDQLTHEDMMSWVDPSYEVSRMKEILDQMCLDYKQSLIYNKPPPFVAMDTNDGNDETVVDGVI